MEILHLPSFEGWALVENSKPLSIPTRTGTRERFWSTRASLVSALKAAGYTVPKNGGFITRPKAVRKARSSAAYDKRQQASSKRFAESRAIFTSFGNEFTEDADGRKIRLFTKENWCTSEDVRDWLIGNRIVEIEDALEFVSKAVLRFLISGDFIRRDDANGFYWVTAKAAKKYELRPILGCSFPS